MHISTRRSSGSSSRAVAAPAAPPVFKSRLGTGVAGAEASAVLNDGRAARVRLAVRLAKKSVVVRAIGSRIVSFQDLIPIWLPSAIFTHF